MNASARPSVKVDLCYIFFTLVVAVRQPLTRIGFPSEISSAIRVFSRKQMSAPAGRRYESGNVPKAVKNSDSGFCRLLSLLCDVSSTSARSLPTAFKRGFRAGRKAGDFSLIPNWIEASSL